ncbi:tryptophan-rich sensory protein [Arthrobacter sp. B0490]|uniref:tryptophan-rich sensory protein n=1 Tax=Arthrobacter sp. B0490 TaxID=2058891 RepID=UPI000CE356A4|nr:tryptophan-rich sensory protein [Arthrobacter sp. B0490]
MSTPKTPGPRLPDKPVRPPRIARQSPAAEPPSDTRSVLERLRAAQPRAAAVRDDEPAGMQPRPADPVPRRESASGGPGPAPGRAGRWVPPATGTAGAATESRGTRPGNGTGSGSGNGSGDGSGLGSGLEGAGPASADRLRIAAGKARVAADATYRAARRGSSVAVRHVGTWDPDIVRQAVVTVSAVACVLGSAAGVGAFGGPSIRDAAGGLFAPDATLLAPSSSAFSIWSVIYAGLVAFTVFQWLPSQRRSARQRRLGWIVAASMLLNLAWILSAQAGLAALSLVVIMLLFFALLAAVSAMNDHHDRTRLEGALVDVPIGLYLGWVLVAAAANAAAVLTGGGVDLFGWGGRAWAVLGIIAVLMTAAVICSTDRGRLSVAAATSWGLLWIAVERVLGQPFAVNVAFVAALAIFLLLITAGSRRHRVDHAYRRWLRAQEDAEREPLDLTGDDYEESRY